MTLQQIIDNHLHIVLAVVFPGLLLSFGLISDVSAETNSTLPSNSTIPTNATIPITNSTNPTNSTEPITNSTNSTVPTPIQEPEPVFVEQTEFTSFYDEIIAELTNIRFDFFDNIGTQSQTIVSSIFDEIDERIPQEPEPVPLRDCSGLERLSEAWWDCTRYNQDVKGAERSQESKDEFKDAMRGF